MIIQGKNIRAYHKGENFYIFIYMGFPGGSDGKEPACNVGDPGSIPGSERYPGEGQGNTL